MSAIDERVCNEAKMGRALRGRDSFAWIMLRGPRALRLLVASAVLAAVLVLHAPFALAQANRTAFLADKLRADDFRIRTKAALELGATADDAAVQPLCGALSDESVVVRQAAAVGLRRLAKPAARGCLESRTSLEANRDVKLQIDRALAALPAPAAGGAASAATTPRNNPNALYYVALSPIANQTGRPQAELDAIVVPAVLGKLDSAGSVQVAPAKESPTDARTAIKGRKLKGGFYLAVAVDKPNYSGGRLVVKVRVGVFSYPNKSLIGNVDKTLTQEGVAASDKAAEDNLIGMAAGLAAEQFAQNASAFL